MKFSYECDRQKNGLLKEGEYKSTKELVERVERLLPDNRIFAELDKDKNLIYYTAKDLLNDVENLGDGLINIGLKGKHVVIMAENSYRYIVCDLAVSGGVGVVTPIDKDATGELLITLLSRCDANAIICSAYLLKQIEKVLPSVPLVKTVITIDKKVEGYLYLLDLINDGKNLKNKTYRDNVLDLDAPAKILFTSGTTGSNKPVVLSQKNLAANFVNCLMTIIAPKNEKDNTSMSILPMHHATELNTHVLARVACGRLTYINDQMKSMMINIKYFKPYVITVVPMIANAFYKQIWFNAKKLGKEDKLKKGIKLSNFLRKFGIDITRKLFKDIYEPFGGNLTQIVCGGAMLNPEVVKGFNDLGINVLNGYGITECGPLVSINNFTLKNPTSVGKPCTFIRTKLDGVNEYGVGELCIKGKSVSSGYYKCKEDTLKVFDEDGYFHTGDLARIDKKGLIYLTGRKKNVIVLGNGKNVCPEEIENEIENRLDYIKEVVVYSCQVSVNGITNQTLCAGIYIEDENLRKDGERIINDFRALNKILPSYKQVNYVSVANSEYEKTSTKKIKRDTVLDKHDYKNGLKI